MVTLSDRIARCISSKETCPFWGCPCGPPNLPMPRLPQGRSTGSLLNPWSTSTPRPRQRNLTGSGVNGPVIFNDFHVVLRLACWPMVTSTFSENQLYALGCLRQLKTYTMNTVGLLNLHELRLKQLFQLGGVSRQQHDLNDLVIGSLEGSRTGKTNCPRLLQIQDEATADAWKNERVRTKPAGFR